MQLGVFQPLAVTEDRYPISRHRRHLASQSPASFTSSVISWKPSLLSSLILYPTLAWLDPINRHTFHTFALPCFIDVATVLVTATLTLSQPHNFSLTLNQTTTAECIIAFQYALAHVVAFQLGLWMIAFAGIGRFAIVLCVAPMANSFLQEQRSTRGVHVLDAVGVAVSLAGSLVAFDGVVLNRFSVGFISSITALVLANLAQMFVPVPESLSLRFLFYRSVFGATINYVIAGCALSPWQQPGFFSANESLAPFAVTIVFFISIALNILNSRSSLATQSASITMIFQALVLMCIDRLIFNAHYTLVSLAGKSLLLKSNICIVFTC
jgi:hypothetical protein